ncbi:MAG: sulfate adenylyltransferase [Firmicutes bacterium]|nr:sulfate adenylyltransferase [Bacillota bacterium]
MNTVSSVTPARVTIPLTAVEAADAELLAMGAYEPLNGFMTQDEYRGVVHDMRLPSGSLFPLPIVLPVAAEVAHEIAIGDVVNLAGPGGFQAILRVTDRFERSVESEARHVYLTNSREHPGVDRLFRMPRWCLAGPVTVVHVTPSPYGEPATPKEVRAAIAQRGWRTVTFFQTRNPPHRAHEYLLKTVLEITDGLVLHPLVGPTKSDDVPASIRIKTYRALISGYFPANRVLLATFGAAMRYAGPREALFHALVRKNFGATHFIVGRDAAGVGYFYQAEAARQLLERLAPEIGITPVTFDDIGYCCRCQATVSRRTCPHPSDWIQMSGTMVRRLLRQGTMPPTEVMRPEVAEILMAAFQEES